MQLFQYLSVFFYQTLVFEDHIIFSYNKASCKLGALAKIRKHVDQYKALILYESLVLPHFDYCDTVFMTTTNMMLNKVQLLQNNVCRTILLAIIE